MLVRGVFDLSWSFVRSGMALVCRGREDELWLESSEGL
jgi:hypothetical protein